MFVNVKSPLGLPRVPSRRTVLLGCNVPNSRKIRAAYPSHTWVVLCPIAGPYQSRSITRTLATAQQAADKWI